MAKGNLAEVDNDNSTVTSTLSPDGEETARAKSEWVHFYFGLSRRPQSGSMTLVFPGLVGMLPLSNHSLYVAALL